jgi:tRNA 2-thiouridine synthesizing protein A
VSERDRRTPDLLEDARGLLCPIPVIKLAERISEVEIGSTVLLLADDPAAEEDVRLWCRGHGQELLEVARAGRSARIRVRRLR